MQEEVHFQTGWKDLKKHHFSKVYVIQVSSMHLSGHQLYNIKCNAYFLWTFVYKYPFAVWILCLLIFYRFCMADNLLHFFSCGHCPLCYLVWVSFADSAKMCLQGAVTNQNIGRVKGRYAQSRKGWGRANKQKDVCFSLLVTHFFITEEFSNEKEI